MVKKKTLTEQLIDKAEECSKKTGRSVGRIAVLAGGSYDFFSRLEGGGNCTTKTYEAMVAKIDELNKTGAL